MKEVSNVTIEYCSKNSVFPLRCMMQYMVVINSEPYNVYYKVDDEMIEGMRIYNYTETKYNDTSYSINLYDFNNGMMFIREVKRNIRDDVKAIRNRDISPLKELEHVEINNHLIYNSKPMFDMLNDLLNRIIIKMDEQKLKETEDATFYQQQEVFVNREQYSKMFTWRGMENKELQVLIDEANWLLHQQINKKTMAGKVQLDFMMPLQLYRKHMLEDNL